MPAIATSGRGAASPREKAPQAAWAARAARSQNVASDRGGNNTCFEIVAPASRASDRATAPEGCDPLNRITFALSGTVARSEARGAEATISKHDLFFSQNHHLL